MSDSVLKRVWVRYKNPALELKTRVVREKHGMSHSDIYALGVRTMLENERNITSVHEENAYAEGYIYFKDAGAKGIVPWKVVADAGRKANIKKIRIYRMDELLYNKIAVMYKEEGSDDFQSIKKLRKHIDNELLVKFGVKENESQ
jgi:hypothetical protein